MKTFTITRFIKPHGWNKGTRLGINSFLALFILIFFSTNGIASPLLFKAMRTIFHHQHLIMKNPGSMLPPREQ